MAGWYLAVAEWLAGVELLDGHGFAAGLYGGIDEVAGFAVQRAEDFTDHAGLSWC